MNFDERSLTATAQHVEKRALSIATRASLLLRRRAEAQTLDIDLRLELLRRYIIHAELVRVLDEGLLQIAHDLLAYGLLHGEMPFQVLHVALRQRLAIVAATGLLLLAVFRTLLLAGRGAHRHGAIVAGRLLLGLAASVLPFAAEAKDVPQMRDVSVHGLLPRHGDFGSREWQGWLRMARPHPRAALPCDFSSCKNSEHIQLVKNLRNREWT